MDDNGEKKLANERHWLACHWPIPYRCPPSPTQALTEEEEGGGTTTTYPDRHHFAVNSIFVFVIDLYRLDLMKTIPKIIHWRRCVRTRRSELVSCQAAKEMLAKLYHYHKCDFTGTSLSAAIISFYTFLMNK